MTNIRVNPNQWGESDHPASYAAVGKLRAVDANSWDEFMLVDGLKRRDQQAAEIFFDRYHEQIRKLVLKFLGPDIEHEDVVGQVFVEILNAISKLRDPVALTKFVSSVTINTVRGEIRRRQSRRRVVLAQPEPTQQGELTSDQLLLRVYRILRTMGADEQVVFVLHYLEGYTFDEIACLRKWSIATAKRRGKKCKLAFLQRLGQDPLLSRYVTENDRE